MSLVDLDTHTFGLKSDRLRHHQTEEKKDSCILHVIGRATAKIKKCVSEPGDARDRNRKGDSRWLPIPQL